MAGPMRGLTDLNYSAFHSVEKLIRRKHPGWRVFNPARAFGGDTTRDLRDYLASDLTLLLAEADSIMFLPGWEGSEGALIEYGIARALGLDFGFVERVGEIVGDVLAYSYEPGEFHKAQEWPQYAPVAYEAHRLVFGDRGTAYGHPEENFQDIAGAWNAQLGAASIDACEVADMMTLFKIARGKHGYKRDNVVDAIGYQIAKQRVVDGK